MQVVIVGCLSAGKQFVYSSQLNNRNSGPECAKIGIQCQYSIRTCKVKVIIHIQRLLDCKFKRQWIPASVAEMYISSKVLIVLILYIIRLFTLILLKLIK